MANFGEVDTRQVESLRRVLGGAVDRSLKTRAMELEVNRQKALHSARNSVLGAYADALRKADSPYSVDVLNAGSEAATKALAFGDKETAEALLFDVRTRASQIPTVKAPNLPEGFAQITDPKVKAETYNKTYGTNLQPSAFVQKATPTADLSVKKAVADSKRTLARAQKTITDFEANPTLSQNYQKIVNDPEFNQAVGVGDIDMASAILAKLVGDTTPQRVLTKKYFDYIKAVNDEEGEMAYLKELGLDTKTLTRKPKAKETKTTKDLRNIF